MPKDGKLSDSALQKLRNAGFLGARAGRPNGGGPAVYHPGPYKKQVNADRRPEAPNNESKRFDDAAALSYFQFGTLDRSQSFANPNDTLPIIFGKQEDGEGGVWVSPPLIEQVSKNFNRTFAYVLSQGHITGVVDDYSIYIGKRNASDSIGGINASLVYGGLSGTVCPYTTTAAEDLSCTHDIYRGAIDTLPSLEGSYIIYRVIDQYATTCTFRFRPLGEENKPVYNFDQYKIRVTRLPIEGFAGQTFDVGTVVTTASGLDVEISDGVAPSTYAYLIENEGIDGEQFDFLTYDGVRGIAVEVEQANGFPYEIDKTSFYRDTTLLTVRANLYNLDESVSEPDNLKQLHIFCPNGMLVRNYRADGSESFNPSNRFSDLVANFVENSGNFVGEAIDTVACGEMAAFHGKYKMFFNGVIASTSNFLAYVQEVSPFFLCDLYVDNSTYTFAPRVPLNNDGSIATGALTPVEEFDDNETGEDTIKDAIIMDSYQKTYFDNTNRQPFQAIVSWRSINNHGMEVTKTTTVRFSDTPKDAPEEAFDMSTFATNTEHAEIFAKYVLSVRRYSTHSISFQTPRNVLTSFLGPYDLIQVSLERVNSEGDNVRETDHYLVTSLSGSSDGIYSIEATHFPLNSGASVISNSMMSGSFTISQ